MLRCLWLDPAFGRFADLQSNIRKMMGHYTPRIPFAVTATELPRMKPRIFRDSEITWRHLAASCALPFALPQIRIGNRWYSDGGLLGALPLRAAAELGAKRIIGLQALAEPTSWWLYQGVRAFRGMMKHTPAIPAGVEILEISHGGSLGSLRETIQWKRGNIERWLQQGAEDA